MIRYIDKGTARQHLIDRLMESALNNVGSRADVDAVFLDIAENRLPVWLDEVETYDVAEVKRGRWDDTIIQDILDYLDTALHPIISPEHWNVYSELYDMISMLPSAEWHGKWKDSRCSVCGFDWHDIQYEKTKVSKSPYCPNCGAKMEGKNEND